MTRFEAFIINRAVPLLELPLSADVKEKILRICRDYIDNSRNSDTIGIFRRTAFDIGTASSGNHAPNHKGIPGIRGGSRGWKVWEGGGETAKCTHFEDAQSLTEHYDKHAVEFPKEYGITDKESYLERACAFLSQPTGGDILGYTCPDGKVIRFNRKTTEYAAGYPMGEYSPDPNDDSGEEDPQRICTYMLAKANRKTGKIKPEKAMEYYEKNLEREKAEAEKNAEAAGNNS